jgi:hypothetical protein
MRSFANWLMPAAAAAGRAGSRASQIAQAACAAKACRNRPAARQLSRRGLSRARRGVQRRGDMACRAARDRDRERRGIGTGKRLSLAVIRLVWPAGSRRLGPARTPIHPVTRLAGRARLVRSGTGCGGLPVLRGARARKRHSSDSDFKFRCDSDRLGSRAARISCPSHALRPFEAGCAAAGGRGRWRGGVWVLVGGPGRDLHPPPCVATARSTSARSVGFK